MSLYLTFFVLLLPQSLPPTPCDPPFYLEIQITAAGQQLPNVSINIPSGRSARLTGPQQSQPVHKRTTALIHGAPFHNKTDSDGLEMSDRLSEDM